MQAFIQWCRRTWKRVRTALCQIRERTRLAAKRWQSKAPRYFTVRGCGSLLVIYPSNQFLVNKHLFYRIIFNCQSPQSRGHTPPFTQLSPSLYPDFHVSCIKPVVHAPSCPFPVPVDGSPVYRVRRLCSPLCQIIVTMLWNAVQFCQSLSLVILSSLGQPCLWLQMSSLYSLLSINGCIHLLLLLGPPLSLGQKLNQVHLLAIYLGSHLSRLIQFSIPDSEM